MKIKTTLVSVLLLVIFNNISAQVTSSFSTDVVSGCSPLKVTFTNNSTGTNLVYVWNFGNGNSSIEENPQAIYTNPGTYNVKLTVSDGTSSDESNLTITVFTNPIANFEADDVLGCTPFNVHFQNTSTLGDAPIEEFKWDFRSGFVDNRENPSYTYTSSGKYDVFLEVIDTNECKSFKEEQEYIEVVSSPTSIFSMNPSQACSAPADVSFSNFSSGSGTLTYEWDFGDGTNSTNESPTHTFSNVEDYVVKLTVNSEEYGCSTSTTQLFEIKDINAGGTLEQDGEEIIDGDFICPGEISYTSTSTGTENVYWIFGDGDVSYAKEGTHKYEKGGEYIVKLIADPGNPCADTVTWNIEIDSITANFSFTPENSCFSPTEVVFSDSSVNAVSWSWEFNDTTSSAQNPTHSYSVTKNTDEFAENQPESFITRLTVESDNGCSHTTEKGFIIQLPTSKILSDKIKGCLPLAVDFTEKSISDLEITNYEWIFGDGQTSSGTSDSESHTYNTAGEYDAKLVITNSDGCNDTSYHLKIEVGKALSPDFTLSSNNVCQNESVTITNNTPESELVDIWYYGLNSEQPLKSVSPLQDWVINADTGYVDISLSVVYNGCQSTITKENYLYNKGPIADFDFALDCETPLVYDFVAKPKKYDSFLWDFGDGTTETTELNPQHTYSGTGNRLVKLILTNGACADTMEHNISIRQPNATITAVDNTCSGDTVLFDPMGSYEQVDYCFEKYYWNFNDTSLANIRTAKDTLKYVFNKGGEYDVDLVTFYDNGCYDTATHHIQVFSPELKFKVDSFLGCAPVIVTFNDSSESYIHPMEEWIIDFGDGTDSIYNNQVKTFSHVYSSVGSFEVELSITDTVGCSAHETKNINIGNPKARFNTLTSTEICAGNPIIFAPISQFNDSVIWNFGDGIITNDTSNIVTHQYDSVGNFEASLIVFEYGCSDTFKTEPNYIKVQKADAFFSASDTFFNCYPKEITFNHTDLRSDIRHGRWEFGYKENYSEYDTLRQFTYPIPGEYFVSLDIETTFGCEDKFERKIVLTGPQGSFDISPDTACKGEMIKLEVLDTSDVYNFEWDLGDGKIVQGNPVMHAYNEIGNVFPKLVLHGDSMGKCIPPPFEDTLYIYELKADIGLEDSSLCAQTDIVFNNSTFGHSAMLWNFGDGSTSTNFEPSHNFSPGDYKIKLVAENDYGCSDTIEQDVVVNPLPQITLSKDSLICFGGTATLRATGGDKIVWEPNHSLLNNLAYITDANPDSTTIYLAVVTDTITGCNNSGNIEIEVQQVPNVDIDPMVASLVIGEEIQFTVDSVSGYTYEWSPAEYFNCITCANAIAVPATTSTIVLKVKDLNDCFTIPYSIDVTVEEKYSVDVPTAFTPNGDGVNDIIYVNGWGIKKLVSFRIFNRWGNEVFFSEDMNFGWDGTYKGKLQNVDTYVYVVEVETYAGELTKETGTITLLQ